MYLNRLHVKYIEGEWGDYLELYTYSISKNCFFRKVKISLVSVPAAYVLRKYSTNELKEFLYGHFVINRRGSLTQRRLKKLK